MGVAPGDAPDVSLVIPMYNEQENVAPMCAAIRDALAGWDRDYEVVIVDDGSRDETPDRLQREAESDPRLRVVRMRRNGGQTLAMATGFARARGEIVVSLDGDLQNDPRDVPLLVERLESGYEVVCGWRKDRKDKWLSRKVPSRIANRIIAWLTGIAIHDNGCSLKAYRADVIRSLNLYSEMHRFLPALASMTGARIDEVVVRHHPRTRGTSKYGIARTFRVLADIVTIKMITQFGSRPGVWFSLLAVPWLLAGLGCGAWWLVTLSILDRGGSIVYPSLSLMFLYLAGHMLTLAILSELLLVYGENRYLYRLARLLTVSSAPDGLPKPALAGEEPR
jgi:glycosyltransferase involved in cell wall biosynthesis